MILLVVLVIIYRFFLVLCFCLLFFNPLRPNSDLSQTSHCNIKGLSVSEVMRIENMITLVKFYYILTATPHYFCKKCMETQKDKCNLILGLKGLMKITVDSA